MRMEYDGHDNGKGRKNKLVGVPDKLEGLSIRRLYRKVGGDKCKCIIKNIDPAQRWENL